MGIMLPLQTQATRASLIWHWHAGIIYRAAVIMGFLTGFVVICNPRRCCKVSYSDSGTAFGMQASSR